jgi:hypothetical protein
MEQSIASLSPEQAQHAVMIFYDLVPDDFWEDGKKPSAAKIKYTAEQLQEEASDDVQPFINALLAEGGEEGKGETSKVLLGIFHEQESLRSFVEQAAEQARQPHMMPIPLIIGAVLVILAALPKEIDWKKKQLKFGHLKELAEVISKLPKSLYDQFQRGG